MRKGNCLEKDIRREKNGQMSEVTIDLVVSDSMDTGQKVLEPAKEDSAFNKI